MTKQKVLPVFAVLVFLATVLPVVENVADNTSTHTTSHVKIRGSVCVYNVSTANPIFIMLGYVIPLTVTLVMFYSTHRTLKNCVVEMDTDHSVVRSVLVMNVIPRLHDDGTVRNGSQHGTVRNGYRVTFTRVCGYVV